MAESTIKSEVKKVFTKYLEEHGQRKTAERFSILEEIYSMSEHFDVDFLFVHMKKKGHRVSRATIYNTIELLLESNLVTKHQFGKNIAQFEKAFESKQHDHLICTQCGSVTEFCDPSMQIVLNNAASIMQFSVAHHSLYIYGICKKCSHLKNK